jgi:hypothetical protein
MRPKRIETDEPCEWCHGKYAAEKDGEWVCTTCGQRGWGSEPPEPKYIGPSKPEKSESEPGKWWDA